MWSHGKETSKARNVGIKRACGLINTQLQRDKHAFVIITHGSSKQQDMNSDTKLLHGGSNQSVYSAENRCGRMCFLHNNKQLCRDLSVGSQINF